MYPRKLCHHYGKIHSNYEGKTIDLFKRKRTKLLAAQKKKIKKHVQTDNENALKDVYIVSYHVAQKGEAHTIAEIHIKPRVINIAIACLITNWPNICLKFLCQTILLHDELQIWLPT